MQRRFHIDYGNTPFPQTGKIKLETQPYRLNWRCEILLTRNQEAIEGKRILDLASHDGMFSYACLKLGASHVTGVEGRENLVKSAINNLTGLGYTQEHFSFIQDDVLKYLARVKPKEFDTILCLGIFYHTIRQIELLREIKRIQPTHIILDTYIQRGTFIHPFFFHPYKSPFYFHPFNLLKLIARVRLRHFSQIPATLKEVKRTLGYEPLSPGYVEQGGPCLIFRHESHDDEWATIDPIDLSAWPTKSFIEMIFNSNNFSLKQLNWDKKEIKNWTTIEDYKYGNRISYIAQPFE